MRKSVPKVQIYILTYNRPQFIMRAITSVLKQEYDDYEVIVSDNSTNDDTKLILSAYRDPRLKYIRRIPSVSAVGHFNLILSEVISDYFMLFHDDDEMHPLLVGELFHELQMKAELAAVGANAFVRREKVTHEKLYVSRYKKDFLLTDRNDVALLYLQGKNIVPFPSYLYRRIVAERIRLNYSNGGKYCDVSFLMDVADVGKIKIKTKPLLYSTIHEEQDSQINEFVQRITLIRYITNTTKYGKNTKLIKKYRIANLLGELKYRLLKKGESTSWKKFYHVVCPFIVYSPLNKFPKLIYLMLNSILRSTVKIDLR